MTGVSLVMAREPLPLSGPSVFLAGPTPDKRAPVPSWRPDAIESLQEQWTGPEPLTVLSPESRHGRRADRYEDQVDWETDARAAADAILFWIPRDLRTLPGFTTNVEFGLDVSSGRAVLGCPPDCPNPERNRYLIHVARRHGVPVCATLADTVAAALHLTAATNREELVMGRKITVQGDITGDVGVVIKGNSGPIVANGDVYSSSETHTRTFTGDGAVFHEGDNDDGISRNF